MLLALLCEQPSRGPLHAFTWDIPGCDDARYAREVTRNLGIQHHFFELKPDWLLHKADEGVRLTDGLGNVVNLHALATLESESRYAQVIYKGFMGDAMMGFGLGLQFWANYNHSAWPEAHLQMHIDQGLLTFQPQEHGHLFAGPFHCQVEDALAASYASALAESGSEQLADQRIHFDLRQRVPRMTLNGVKVVESQAVVRLPYCDKDLLEFSLGVPPGLRYERRLMKDALIHTFPELAKVPYTETHLPLAPCARELLIRSNWHLRWRLRAAGLRWVPAPQRRPYANYGDWFRTVLRSWLEETLLDQHALQRGYFQPDYVRQLVREHMAGAKHTVKLGALLTLELWHRQFLD
jgi:asparagine synthase (glutamine-hydrolysing)